ncbi:MAG TPA: HPr kinase/phosphatase C-terminal domain-containing protein [Acetobacteraceae bacterium]|nr:HPr kinase/phosphatase C-terminal domain-containing protein [Acetobacteraceae bacterium]
MNAPRQVYGSCAARDGHAVLVTGPSGAGKSDLVLRLLDRGFQLVADDRVELAGGYASAPAALAGLLEVRGLGILRLPYLQRARLALLVRIARETHRLPAPQQDAEFGVPVIRLIPDSASAPQRVALALDCALGRIGQVAGAFAA